MPRLIAPTGHTLDLPARHLTFGAAPQCDIPLSAEYGLAGIHFEVAPAADGTIFLRDASGGAGTLINGQPVATTALKEGDVIQAGQLTLRFSAMGSPEAAPDPAPRPPGSPAPGSQISVHAQALGGDPSSPSLPAPPPLPISRPSPVRLPRGGEIVTADHAQTAPSAPLQPVVESPGAQSPPMIFSKASGRQHSLAPSPLVVRVASVVLLGLAAAAFCATDPGQRLLAPVVSKVQHWNTARAPKPKSKSPAPATSGLPATKGPAATASSAPGTAPVSPIIPQTSHEEITRRLLTERTQTYIYADLRQLIPSYNLMASQQGLPSQREMSEFFRKTYGAVIDPFEQLGYLQSDTPEEFLIVLTAKAELDLEKVIGQPARPAADGRSGPTSYTLKTGTRSLSAALYDPFSLLLGSPRAIARALQKNPGAQLREARCMFPETAARTPGALILVKRVNLPAVAGSDEPATAFETIVTNLFLGTTASTLSLVRNPDVSEKSFVDAAAPALREQAAALAPSLGTDATAFATLAPGEISLTLNEATVSLPGGPALISSTLEGIARSFVRAAPSMNHILQAQDAVMQFNTVRATGAENAIKATSPREALELLNDGIRGGGSFSGATITFKSPGADLENLSALLAIDEGIGLVYRPDAEVLSGNSLALALKARNYRNAELFTLLWKDAGLQAGDEETPATAARRVLAWATTPDGKRKRSALGLPTELTPDEMAGALAHLAITDRQLAWKPGEANYRSWVRLVHPDPHRDASRLAAAFNAAAAAGAIPASATREVKAALTLITRGVSGRGEHAGRTFKVDTLTPAELEAAGGLLTLEDGTMKVRATPARNPP